MALSELPLVTEEHGLVDLPPGARDGLAMPLPGSKDWHRALTARITLYENDKDKGITAIVGVIINGRSINRVVQSSFETAGEAYTHAVVELTKLYAGVGQHWPAKHQEAGQ